MIDNLISFGLEEKYIKKCAGTGLVVDIWGKGSEDKSQECKMIALRTDLDGLPIPENNHHLPYRTVTDFAHMCGHDGHMATILAAA